MPSTRRQKAKPKRLGEMDILSNYDNVDVMLGGENTKSLEISQGIEIRNFNVENDIPRLDRL